MADRFSGAGVSEELEMELTGLALRCRFDEVAVVPSIEVLEVEADLLRLVELGVR